MLCVKNKNIYIINYTVNQMARKWGMQDGTEKCKQYKMAQKSVNHILVYILRIDFGMTLYFTVANWKRHHMENLSLASIIIYLKWIFKK